METEQARVTQTVLVLGGTGKTGCRLTEGARRALGREPKDFADYAREAAATGVWEGKL